MVIYLTNFFSYWECVTSGGVCIKVLWGTWWIFTQHSFEKYIIFNKYLRINYVRFTLLKILGWTLRALLVYNVFDSLHQIIQLKLDLYYSLHCRRFCAVIPCFMCIFCMYIMHWLVIRRCKMHVQTGETCKAKYTELIKMCGLFRGCIDSGEERES